MQKKNNHTEEHVLGRNSREMGSPGDMSKHPQYWRIFKRQLSELDNLLRTLDFTRK